MIKKNDFIGFENTLIVIDSDNENRMIFEENGVLGISTVEGDVYDGKWKLNSKGDLIIGFNGIAIKYSEEKRVNKEIHCIKKTKNGDKKRTSLKTMIVNNKINKETVKDREGDYMIVAGFLFGLTYLFFFLIFHFSPFLNGMHIIQKILIVLLLEILLINNFKRLIEVIIIKLLSKYGKIINDNFFK
jgi:hypothetical protein